LQSEVQVPSPGKRLVDWFLVKAELRRAREAASTVSQPRREYLRCAKLAYELGELALAPGKALRSGSGVPLASNLFRQSIYWALLSYGLDVAQPDPAALWAAVDDRLLARIGVDSGERAELDREMGSTFIELAAGSTTQQNATNARLRRCAKRLLVLAEGPRRALESAQQKRRIRLLLLVAPGVGLPLVAMAGVLWPPDLAKGKPWRTSSTYAICHPKEFECAGVTTDIFFHTNVERNPWFEYDFGEPLAFSALAVRNRLDYGLERAVPLVAEVSNDGKSFHEVARRQDWFTTWRPSFPRQHARYLRLRVLGNSALHLTSVAVHR